VSDSTYQPLVYRKQGGNEIVVASGGLITVESGGSIAVASGGSITGSQATQRARSVWFNLDNGSGTTIDDVLMKATAAITITAARIIYVDATSGTVAAGNVAVGTTLGAHDIVAVTAYENTKSVGTETALAIAAGAVAAGGAVFVRHTGVAATAAGQVVIEIEYTVT
jgi:hypothetical protein